MEVQNSFPFLATGGKHSKCISPKKQKNEREREKEKRESQKNEATRENKVRTLDLSKLKRHWRV